MAHPHRKQVHASQVAKCKAIASPLNEHVGPVAPDWNEFGAAKPTMGNKFACGGQAPPDDAANISRMINRHPKMYR